MSKSGIDTGTYKAHSMRGASTSKSLQVGLLVGGIGKAAGWSNTSTMFAIRYNRPVVKNFGETIVRNVNSS